MRQTGPHVAATVPCPMRRFRGLPWHGVTVVTPETKEGMGQERRRQATVLGR